MLCQTEGFQRVTFDILDAVVPTYSAALQNLRVTMFQWTCVDERIIRSNHKPSPEKASPIPGVPVALLPFVMEHVPEPDATDPEFQLLKDANIVICEFWDIIRRLQTENLQLRELPAHMNYKFVMAMHEFFMTYARYTNPGRLVLQASDMLNPGGLESQVAGMLNPGQVAGMLNPGRLELQVAGMRLE